MINESRQIQSVQRAMALLECIALKGGEARLKDLSDELQLNKSTLHGLLNTLSALGYVSRKGTRYALGLRLREVAQTLFNVDDDLRDKFSPLLKKVALYSNETCYLAVPCGTREYLYIDAIDGNSPLRAANPRGRREGLTTSAIGKVFLAYDGNLLRSLRKAGCISSSLEKELTYIAKQGYALDLEEAEAGLNCLAIPLYQEGCIVAALGIAGPSQRLSKPVLEHLAADIKDVLFDNIKHYPKNN